MNKQEIINKFVENHKIFIGYINTLDEAKFTHSKEDKWTAGQQLDHIYRSVSPLTIIFSLPKFIAKLVFGKANRPSITYEEVINKYQKKLQEGGRASGRFVPKEIPFRAKDGLVKKLKKTLNILANQLDRFDEKQLDQIIIPHPLLGKMTVREMMYFTIYHVEHHREITVKNQ